MHFEDIFIFITYSYFLLLQTNERHGHDTINSQKLPSQWPWEGFKRLRSHCVLTHLRFCCKNSSNSYDFRRIFTTNIGPNVSIQKGFAQIIVVTRALDTRYEFLPYLYIYHDTYRPIGMYIRSHSAWLRL